MIFPFLLFSILMGCNNSNQETITKVFQLPKSLDESSAVEITSKSDLIWTLQDSGNEAEIYALDNSGNIKNTIAISNVKNNDWEDLTSDEDGNLYIGDFGNNDNDRKNLSIYKINAADLGKKEASASQTISFYYPEQSEFPPKKSNRVFDSESFFYFNNNFYIFTKNRSSKFDGTTQLYRVPNKPGNHAAILLGDFKTCGVYKRCAVTSADISPDGKKAVILTADKVFVFDDFKDDNFLSGKSTTIELNHFTQKEGICFKDDNTLFITDEKDKKTGGNLYQLRLKN